MADPTTARPPAASARMSEWAHSRWASLLYATDRALDRLSHGTVRLRIYLFCAQPIGRGPHTLLRDDPRWAVRRVDPEDQVVARFPRPEVVTRQRFADRAECHVLTTKEDFAGFLWLSWGAHEEDEIHCRYVLPRHVPSTWDFDVYIDPGHRGVRAMARLWKGVDADLSRQGIRWSYSRIALSNTGSLIAHGRLGALPAAAGAFLSLGPIQLSLFTCAPYAHLGFGRRRPELQLPIPIAQAGDGIARSGPAALVLGLDSHGLSVARALADAGVPTYAVCTPESRHGAGSNRLTAVFEVPSFDAVHLLPALRQLRRRLAGHPEVVLMAVNDHHVRFMGEHRQALQPDYCISWIDRADTVLALQRKSELEARCQTTGLRYPRSVVFTSPEQADRAAGFAFPMIIKPVQPLSSFKTMMVSSVVQLAQLLRQQAQDLPILGQEYVAGDDRCLFFGALMLDRGRVLHAMAGRKLASFPPARGQTTAAETTDAPEVLSLTERFFEGLELTGPVSLEVKRDVQGQYWVIEPTVGRTDFWSELCIQSGFNQPVMEFQLAAGQPVSPALPLRPCIWYDAERDPLVYLDMCRRHRSLRPLGKAQAFLYAGHRDGAPLRRALRKVVLSRLGRWLGRLHRRPT